MRVFGCRCRLVEDLVFSPYQVFLAMFNFFFFFSLSFFKFFLQSIKSFYFLPVSFMYCLFYVAMLA